MKIVVIKPASWLSLLILLTVALPGLHCYKDNGKSKPQYNASGNAIGANVVPATNSTATGSIAGTYTSSDNTLNGTISWTNLSGPPTAIHLHGTAFAGHNNIVQFNFTNFPTTTSGTFNFSSVFTQVQEGWLLAGAYYMDIHTAAFPNGEIRAQIALQ